jgi:hypothetical protein
MASLSTTNIYPLKGVGTPKGLEVLDHLNRFSVHRTHVNSQDVEHFRFRVGPVTQRRAGVVSESQHVHISNPLPLRIGHTERRPSGHTFRHGTNGH